MKKNARRFSMVTAICGGTALLFLALTWGGRAHLEFEPLQWLEFYTQDRRVVHGVKTPADTNLVLIGIDRPDYSTYFSDAELNASPTLQLLQKGFPWSRAVWADLITRLGDAGARVIMLDVALSAQGDGDAALRLALDKYKDRVVIGCNFRDFALDSGTTLNLNVPNASVLNSSSSNSPAFDERVGFFNVWPDWDGITRYARFRLEGGQATDLFPHGAVLESLDARALRQFGHPELIPAGSDPVRFRYTGWAGAGFPAVSLGDVLAPRSWKQNFQNGEFFRGKIVFIGPMADIFQDLHATPFPDRDILVQGMKFHGSHLMPGPELHLNILAAALHRAFLRDASLPIALLIVFAAGLVATALSFLVSQPLIRLAAILLLCFAYWHLGQSLWDRSSYVIPEAGPLLVLILSGIFVLGYDYFVEQFERNRVRKTFERYVSENIVRELLDNPATYYNTLQGVKKPVTVLFSDIRGFTTLTENSDSARLVSQLNEYLEEMVRQVFEQHGTLDKFIGDAVMAVWGNLVTAGPAPDAQLAVATALAMKRSLVQLNAAWKIRGMRELAIGIGINQGEAIVGNLGSSKKMELTVIGDAVNIASRLEGLTKHFHVDLLLGESMAPLVREKFILRTVGLIQAKGKTLTSEVFTVLAERTPAAAQADPQLESWLADYEAAVKLFRARQFPEAVRAFELCRRARPDDYLCQMYLAECATLIQSPPDQTWNAIFIMTEK